MGRECIVFLSGEEHRDIGRKGSKKPAKTGDVIYGRPQKRFSRQALTRSEIEKSF